MVRLKKICLRLFLLLEMVLFGHLYFFGTNGIQALQDQRKAVISLKEDIVLLDGQVAQLEKEIYAWQTDDFYKEKVAREQLQMARKGDELFYIGV